MKTFLRESLKTIFAACAVFTVVSFLPESAESAEPNCENLIRKLGFGEYRRLAELMEAVRLGIGGALGVSRGHRDTSHNDDKRTLEDVLRMIREYPAHLDAIRQALDRLKVRETAIRTIREGQNDPSARDVVLPTAVNLEKETDPTKLGMSPHYYPSRVVMAGNPLTVKQFKDFPANRLLKEDAQVRKSVQEEKERLQTYVATLVYLLRGIVNEVNSESSEYRSIMEMLEKVDSLAVYKELPKVADGSLKLGLRARAAIAVLKAIVGIAKKTDAFVQGAAKPFRNWTTFVTTVAFIIGATTNFRGQFDDLVYKLTYYDSEIEVSTRRMQEHEEILKIAANAGSQKEYVEKVYAFLVNKYPDVDTLNGLRLGLGEKVLPKPSDPRAWDVGTATRIARSVIDGFEVVGRRFEYFAPIPPLLEDLARRNPGELREAERNLDRALGEALRRRRSPDSSSNQTPASNP